MPYKKHPKSTKIVPYSNDTVYSSFVPYGETKTVAPDLTTIDDNRISHIPNQDAPIGEDVALVPIPSNRRWLVVCHAIESPPGLSAVVAITCAEKGHKNTTSVTATTTMPNGFERFTINEKPLTTDFIKNPNLNNFENVIPFNSNNGEFAEHTVATSGFGGEFEYSPGKTVNVYVNISTSPSFSMFVSKDYKENETVETIYVGQGQANRTDAYKNCLSSGNKSSNFKISKAFVSYGSATYRTRYVYLAKVTIVEDIRGTVDYEGYCRTPQPSGEPNPNGEPMHECNLHHPTLNNGGGNPDNDKPSENDDPNNPPPNKRIYTYAAIDPPSYSLYNLFMNFQGKIEYFGSVWVLDPNLPTCVVSKTYSGDVDLKFTYAYEIGANDEVVYKEYYTKYRASKTKATANFSNSGAEMLTITPETASQTLTWQADTIQLLQNVDSSVSQYYGLGELGYVAIVIGAASVL